MRYFDKKWSDDRRPEWQQERGPRHGNNRKMYAKLKVAARKIQRAKSKNQGYEE
jgi:hypothetical protein